MDATLSVSAEEVGSATGDGQVYALGLESLHVSLAGEARCNGDEEAGAEERCQHCKKTLAEDSVSWPEDDGTLRERRVTLDAAYGDVSPEFCDGNMNGSDDHEAEFIPGSFANSANVIVDDDDQVTVTISVGDPRGAFAMTVYRKDDGSLVLSVPDPSDGFPHMRLTPDGPGRFLIS